MNQKSSTLLCCVLIEIWSTGNETREANCQRGLPAFITMIMKKKEKKE